MEVDNVKLRFRISEASTQNKTHILDRRNCEAPKNLAQGHSPWSGGGRCQVESTRH
jgi:hypothetical protein